MKTSRHQARFLAAQALSSYLVTGMNNSLDTVSQIQSTLRTDTKFLHLIYEKTIEQLEILKPILTNIIKTKKFDQLDYILQAILYLSAYELIILKTSVGIVINEYVMITKRFVDSIDYKLVHKIIHDINQGLINTTPTVTPSVTITATDIETTENVDDIEHIATESVIPAAIDA